ncbi:MAG: transglutaminase domain-containing protein [Planctomycetota bacterium]|nr:MAG: transglutaminase domain-containing protein [Planctomycetota bacterium]
MFCCYVDGEARMQLPTRRADNFSRRQWLAISGGLVAWGRLSASMAQEAPVADATVSPLVQYVAPKTYEMLIGARVFAGDGTMVRTTLLTVFPADWPEQTVEVIEAQVPPPLQFAVREMPGGNRQLVMKAAQIAPGSRLDALLRVRIQKSHIVGPEDTTELVVPRRVRADIRNYLGNSPYIEATSSEVRKVAKEIELEDPLTDWKKVEMVYEWVRENIEYRRLEPGDRKTVREAMRDRFGDCEEMTCTFIAICRALRVPARMVWLPGHCYPEFYMEDAGGTGYWLPCQVAGTRNFGSMPEYLPILQKGDRFKVPEKPKVESYLADYIVTQVVGGSSNPEVQFVRQLLGDAASLPAPDLDGQANPG